MCFRERILRRLPSNDLNDMPDDPNRNLEEQLTAWARKRREEAGAPFELHPATRKMLQDEVARTFPKKSDEAAAESAGWWKMFWPRFALAGSLCLAMVILAGILLPGIARSKTLSILGPGTRAAVRAAMSARAS